MQQCEAVLALAAATERLTGVRGLGLGKKSVSTLPPGDTSAEGFFFCHSLGGGQSSYH
jgi:hypothetical protein